MGKLFNSRVLYIIPIIFLVVIVFRITYSYHDTKQQAYDFAKKEAEVLNSHAMVHRTYYQKLFINKTLKLSEKTLSALPAYSSRPISKTFSQNNPFNIHIQTVSDRARNYKNIANKGELKAINFFKNNKDETTYFNDENSEFYQYASVLRIEQKCLKCHGKKENAPKFIQDNYAKAYDYKVGDVRGIMSITIPKDSLNNYFLKYFIYSTIYDILLFFALFFAIYYLVKKSKKINDFLEYEVQSKTNELKESLIIDRLTNLPNRLKLIEDVRIQANYSSQHLALLNIDRFKDINDFYGHEVGDKILQEVAITVKGICTKSNSSIYKLPSDEYALFTTMSITQNEFIKIINHIIMTIQETKYEVNNNTIFITLSCGTASNEKDIMTKADMALQVAKNDKRSLITYDESLDATDIINQNIIGVALLKDAILYDNITPFYQPIYNVRTKATEKYESLARIVQDNGEVIPPFKFLDIAIKSKLYSNITRTIIRKSFEFFRDKDYEFSINLSINDVLNKGTVKFIFKSLEEFDRPQKVVFEILESDKVGNYEELKEFISRVKEFGCKVAIDDFGSGYSNFSHILELNVDYLKIDASLVRYVTTDENSRKITQTIITFASNLGIKTIAEYVEDELSLKLLEEMGVDFVQGYYIGKPESALNKNFD